MAVGLSQAAINAIDEKDNASAVLQGLLNPLAETVQPSELRSIQVNG